MLFLIHYNIKHDSTLHNYLRNRLLSLEITKFKWFLPKLEESKRILMSINLARPKSITSQFVTANITQQKESRITTLSVEN